MGRGRQQLQTCCLRLGGGRGEAASRPLMHNGFLQSLSFFLSFWDHFFEQHNACSRCKKVRMQNAVSPERNVSGISEMNGQGIRADSRCCPNGQKDI